MQVSTKSSFRKPKKSGAAGSSKSNVSLLSALIKEPNGKESKLSINLPHKEQLPLNEKQLPKEEHQPPTEVQPFLYKEQPPLNEKQSPSKEEQLTTKNELPPFKEEQSPSKEKQPSSNKEQPSPKEEHRPIKKERPLSKDKQPKSQSNEKQSSFTEAQPKAEEKQRISNEIILPPYAGSYIGPGKEPSLNEPLLINQTLSKRPSISQALPLTTSKEDIKCKCNVTKTSKTNTLPESTTELKIQIFRSRPPSISEALPLATSKKDITSKYNNYKTKTIPVPVIGTFIPFTTAPPSATSMGRSYSKLVTPKGTNPNLPPQVRQNAFLYLQKGNFILRPGIKVNGILTLWKEIQLKNTSN